MAKVHVLKDEMLGGVKREYVEVEREVIVGDIIVVSEMFEDTGGKFYAKGHKARVISIESREKVLADFNGFNNPFVYDDGIWFVGVKEEGDFAVLEPTDIVIIGGKRYKIEERLAEPGELILNKSNGLTYEVKDVASDFIIVGDS